MTTTGSPFYDPFTTVRASERRQESGHRAAAPGNRSVQTAAEQKALRDASLAEVSRDLQRMLRARGR